jgi:hypothetical protein
MNLKSRLSAVELFLRLDTEPLSADDAWEPSFFEALLETEVVRGDCKEEFEATLLVLPLELSVSGWTFFGAVVGDALTAGFFVASALFLSAAKDVFFSCEGFELTVETDSGLLFFNPSDNAWLAFLASELALSCCFPALPVLLLLCAEPALIDEVDFIREERTPDSAESPPPVRFLFDEAVPNANLPAETGCLCFTGLPSACFEASDGVSISLVTATGPQAILSPRLPSRSQAWSSPMIGSWASNLIADKHSQLLIEKLLGNNSMIDTPTGTLVGILKLQYSHR